MCPFCLLSFLHVLLLLLHVFLLLDVSYLVNITLAHLVEVAPSYSLALFHAIYLNKMCWTLSHDIVHLLIVVNTCVTNACSLTIALGNKCHFIVPSINICWFLVLYIFLSCV